MYMDFHPSLIAQSGHGNYRRIDASLLPQLYLVYTAKVCCVFARSAGTSCTGEQYTCYDAEQSRS